MKTKIEIKSIYGSVLFSFEKENNTQRETILEAIRSYANLRNANLSYADLGDADLRYANLGDADLRNANLRNANLSYADLGDADLRNANLSYANLSNANLSYADLSDADLGDANLRNANLRNANLRYANLCYANLSEVRHNEGTSFLLSQCPTDGAFIAWKKANRCIVKLRITENAKRSSATTLKCRCSEAEVLEIQDFDGNRLDLSEVASSKDSTFLYKVGEIVRVDDFDDNRWNECSAGIHFFISREMAVKY